MFESHQGWVIFQKILTVSRKPSAVECGCCFSCVICISYVNLQKQICICIKFMLFSFFELHEFSLHVWISFKCNVTIMIKIMCMYICTQTTGLDAWASRVKFPARFVSHLHEICIYIYIWVVYSFCLFCCSFIVVTWWYMWCIMWASGNQEEVQACLVTLIWLDKNQNHLLQSRNDVLMSLVERVHQGENLVHWLNWLTEPPAVCQSVIMGDLPSEGDHLAELCKAWPS